MFDAMFKTGIKSAYSISDSGSFTAGGWKVYQAKHRQSGKRVSAFIFDKAKFESQIRALCSQSSSAGNSKLIIEDTYRILKTEVSQLTRLKHPQLLAVVEALEESKLKFTFVTEQVSSTLLHSAVSHEEKAYFVKGLYEISKGLQFLHVNCLTVHLDLQPASVFINDEGDWKLGGFKFLQQLEAGALTASFYINASSIVPFANYNFDFVAPELILEGFSQKLSLANDMWSLGMLVFWIYNGGEQLFNCLDKVSISDYKAEYRSFERKFRGAQIDSLQYLFKEVPKSMYHNLASLLALDPRERMSIDSFLNLDIFQGSFLKVMVSFDEFSAKLILEKNTFITELLNDKTLIEVLPSAIINTKLIPIIVNTIISELGILKDGTNDSERIQLIASALNLVLTLGKVLSAKSFLDRIYTPLLKSSKDSTKGVFAKLISCSASVRLSLVSNFDTLIEKLPEKNVTAIFKQIAENCLDVPSNQREIDDDQVLLQNEFLLKIPRVAGNFDYTYTKGTLIPLVCKVFKTTTVLSTKLSSISTFEALVKQSVLDRELCIELVLPLFANLKSRNKSIIDAVLSFFQTLVFLSKVNLDVEGTINNILCEVLRLVFSCNDCNQAEFKAFLKTIDKIQSHTVERKLSSLKAADHLVSTSTTAGKSLVSPTQTSYITPSQGGQANLSGSSLKPSSRNDQISKPVLTTSNTAVQPQQQNKSDTSIDWTLAQKPRVAMKLGTEKHVLSPSFVPLQPQTQKKNPPGFSTYLVLTPKRN